MAKDRQRDVERCVRRSAGVVGDGSACITSLASLLSQATSLGFPRLMQLMEMTGERICCSHRHSTIPQTRRQKKVSSRQRQYLQRHRINGQFIPGTRVSWIRCALPLLQTHLLLRRCSHATGAPASWRRRRQGTRGVETRKRLVLRRISGRVGSRRTARPPHPLLPMRLLLLPLLLRRRVGLSRCSPFN